MKSDAVLSADRAYRYALWRAWDERLESVMFIALNPSTADERTDDPTLRRCMGFARNWGYGSVTMANLFAWRATEPRDLLTAPDPIGPDNDAWLERLAAQSGLVVAAWGNHGAHLGRAARVRDLLPGLSLPAIESFRRTRASALSAGHAGTEATARVTC